MKSTIGAEIELLLVHKDGKEKGYVANRAIDVLKGKWNKGRFVPETKHSVVEFNSEISNNIDDLVSQTKKSLRDLEERTAEFNVMPISVSETGAGKGTPLQRSTRSSSYDRICTPEVNEAIGDFNGTHIHLSQYPERKTDQYNLLLALHPLSVAISSTSPVNSKGINGANSQRALLFQEIGKVFPWFGSTRPAYSTSRDSLERATLQRYEQWQERAGLQPSAFHESFQPENTGYVHVRNRPTFNTWEVRGPDSATIDTTIALAALYKGIYDRLFHENIDMTIAKNSNGRFTEKRVSLPDQTTLLQLEDRAIKKGIKDPYIRSYLSDAVQFAKSGLEPQDQQYLEPMYSMLRTGRNLADDMMLYIGTHKKLTSQQSAAINLYMRARYLNTLT